MATKAGKKAARPDTPKGLYFFGPLSQSLCRPLRAFGAPNSKSAVLSLLAKHAVGVATAA